MNKGIDRLQELVADQQKKVTGIDFVFVEEGQKKLAVHFLKPPSELQKPLAGTLEKEQIRIYSLTLQGSDAEIPITSIGWDQGPNILQINTERRGDFTLYKLLIDDPRVDPYFNDVTFSFKAGCKSDLDCKTRPHECPVEKSVDFPVDYQARDFWSFRQALLDFASQRYPDWQERLEADAGIMLAEVMSALGDEMAYYQDRVAREAYLETATQRRSLRRHARLVDYEIHNGRGAVAWLDITVKAGQSGDIDAGADVWAVSDSGYRIDFEVGHNLQETLNGKKYHVDAKCNSFDPHIWDEEDTCLPAGATKMYLKGSHKAHLPFDDLPEDGRAGKWVLLQTSPKDFGLPVRIHPVRLISIEEKEDILLGETITRLEWESGQALPFEMDLRYLKVRGNIIPVSAGKTIERDFVTGGFAEKSTVPAEKQKGILRAVERQGPEKTRENSPFQEKIGQSLSNDVVNGIRTYLFTLPGSETTPLVWLGDDIHKAYPEIYLSERVYDTNIKDWKTSDPWNWRRSLVEYSSQALARDYTLDDGSWRRIVGFRRNGEEIIHEDYASGAGISIRFGDGEFGLIPAQETVFKVTYRLGGGKTSNVPAGALIHFESSYNFIEQVTNPLPAIQGEAPELPAAIRQLAPEAFRAVAYRAVTREDYAEAVERLDWVQRAGAAFRWTGSWLSAFVTPDPKGAVMLAEDQRRKAADQLDRFRQAGRETHVMDPQYADIDLEIVLCEAPHAFRGEVKEQVLAALLGKGGVRPRPGFFAPDRFTFGTPLRRSGLEATVQAVPGVLAGKEIRYKRRGWSKDWQLFSQDAISPGMDTIIRIANDPLHPEWGTVKILFSKSKES